jgi:hypothetical protein
MLATTLAASTSILNTRSEPMPPGRFALDWGKSWVSRTAEGER